MPSNWPGFGALLGGGMPKGGPTTGMGSAPAPSIGSPGGFVPTRPGTPMPPAMPDSGMLQQLQARCNGQGFGPVSQIPERDQYGRPKPVTNINPQERYQMQMQACQQLWQLQQQMQQMQQDYQKQLERQREEYLSQGGGRSFSPGGRRR